MDGSGETREELIELAMANGHEASPEQLARWHRHGLLPKPMQVPLGRGRGTRSVYPTGTGEQLLALCRIHLDGREKRLDYVAWRLWWDGYEVSMVPVRRLLGRVAEQVDRDVRDLGDPDGGGLSDEALDQVEQATYPSVRLARPPGRGPQASGFRELRRVHGCDDENRDRDLRRDRGR